MIFPAIDLQDGRSVRLYKGDFAQETVINPDPVAQAKQYEAAKVGALHLVDLDGAKAGKPVNVDIVKAVRAAFTGILEIGGGIRDKEAVDLYLGLGVNHVILGSVALKNPELTKQVIAEYGAERIVIGVDGKNGKVAAEGWLDQSDVPMTDLIGAMVEGGAKYFIVTDVDRDGTMQGANEELLGNLQKEFPTARIERVDMQYLYSDGGLYYFMNVETFDQVGLTEEQVGDSLKFVKENEMVKICSHNGNVFAIEPPLFVELVVTETEPGFAGNTAQGATKPAIVETGAQVMVPLFVNQGDKLKIDTRTGEYLSRV